MRSRPPRYKPKPKPPKPPKPPKRAPAKPKPKRFTVDPLDFLIELQAWYVRNGLALKKALPEIRRGKKRKSKHPTLEQIMGGIDKYITRTLEAQADEEIRPPEAEVQAFDPDDIPF
jgi:hypothetical protein